MKRIALAIENFSRFAGGAESYAVSLAGTLVDHSWEVHVFAQKWDGEPRGVIFHPVPVPAFLPRFLKLLLFALRHRRAVEREPFDVVLGFGNTIVMNVYQSHGGVHWLSTDRKLYTCNSTALRSLKRFFARISPKHQARHWIESAPFRQKTQPKLIAISHMIQNDLATYFHVDRGEIEVVYNGVDLQPSTGSSREGVRKMLRMQFGIPDSHVVFLFVSFDLRKKGIEQLVDAAGLLRKSGKTDFSVIVVGGRPYRSLQRRIDRRGVGDAIHFPGPTKQIGEYYAGSDVFVLPTFYDACSLVVLEAMAWGLPAITTEYNGASGVIETGVNGFVISHPPRPDELTSRMAALLEEDERRRMGGCATLSMKGYSLRSNHERMLRIFDDVANRKRSA